ncbi:MAG: 30S ribosomal protein S17 [bacterium]
MTEKDNRKRLTGKVVSDKMDKTRVVAVSRTVTDPFYSKVIRIKKKYYIHDQNNECSLGDVVQFRESRPLSKLKRWRLDKILVKSKA